MWSPTSTLLKKCQYHRGLAEQSMKTTLKHPKKHELSQIHMLSRKTVTWINEVFTVVGPDVHYECTQSRMRWYIFFLFDFCVHWDFLVSVVHIGKCSNYTVLFQRRLNYKNLIIYIYIYCTHAITGSTAYIIHYVNIPSDGRVHQRSVSQTFMWLPRDWIHFLFIFIILC